MTRVAIQILLFAFIGMLAGGCANIVPPSGGAKDTKPPKLVSVSPADSGLNVRYAKIRFDFDEYISLTDAATQVVISPLLPINPTVLALGKHLTIQFPDSLLLPNTTYRITLGTSVRDLNEGNTYAGKGFIFSTGSIFDSLAITGRVVDAMNGLVDTSATVLLYNATDGDSVVVNHRPLYATHVDASGNFSIQGLPARPFKIYALRDKNTNLVFDDLTEWIAFHDYAVLPGQDSSRRMELRTFPLVGADTASAGKFSRSKLMREGTRPVGGVGYTVAVDTVDTKKRSQDITKPLLITFYVKPQSFDKDKFFLAHDSSGITVESPLVITEDTIRHTLSLNTPWAENALYTLRLQKGFAKDSAAKDYLPGRYTFRTQSADDYAKLTIHLPTKYYGAGFILQVSNEQDTIYKKPVVDSNVVLARIKPGNYKMMVIVDANKNGIWDTGDLFGKKQPERVVPFERTLLLKPGWENQQDFDPMPEKPTGKTPAKK